jgi:hypothetical protein
MLVDGRLVARGLIIHTACADSTVTIDKK